MSLIWQFPAVPIARFFRRFSSAGLNRPMFIARISMNMGFTIYQPPISPDWILLQTALTVKMGYFSEAVCHIRLAWVEVFRG